MSNLLDKYKNANSAKPSKPTTAATQQAKPAAPVTNTASRLAELKNRTNKSNLVRPTPEQAKAKTEAETAAIEKALNEVPEDIYVLKSDIYEIDGFDAEQFSTLLATTYQSLLKDEPDLPKLLEMINKNLRQHEELSYLLNEEQLSLYLDGLMHIKDVVIKTTKPKAKTSDTQQQVAREGGLDLT